MHRLCQWKGWLEVRKEIEDEVRKYDRIAVTDKLEVVMSRMTVYLSTGKIGKVVEAISTGFQKSLKLGIECQGKLIG